MIDHTDNLVYSAGEAVARLEALELGEPFADAADAAAAAVGALRDPAVAELFPCRLSPAPDAALRDFEMATRSLGRVADCLLAELHVEAVAGEYPALAEIIRGPRGRRLVVQVAETRATPTDSRETHATAAKREAATAVAAFERAIAAQLVGVEEFEPAATLLAETLPDLEGRIAEARCRHQDFADEELGRIERERTEVDRVLGEQQAEARREAEAEAAEVERQAIRARREVELGKARAVADRLERSGEKYIRFEAGGQHLVAEVVQVLRTGGFSRERRAAIEQVLDRGEAA